MDAEKWKKVKPILEEVLEIPPESRSEFLEKSCSGDKDLHLELEKLLAFEESASDLLEQEAISAVLGNHLSTKKLINEQIGNYKIIDELGSGGMGTVYLAERADGAFEQKVALKIIKRGMDTDAVLRRFFNERQILASLEHPNIAHLVDGGTTADDLPYIVMEYVKGENIIEFAGNKKLDIEARLDLFREVCAAVSFAHQNLIIHRDLKPSNILVNAEGIPKLLDFGIAKLLKIGYLNQTATKHFAFTPEYASPEQIRGENLSTATDVYSLGVILYELLTGIRPFPFDGKNFGQILQTVTQSEPLRPSAIQISSLKESNSKFKIQNSKSLRGDLDNIVLKALKKEPERRYSSVEQFSEDIRRHLKGLPIFARQDTFFYRAEKFVQRNRLAAAAAALAFLILIGGIFAVMREAKIADSERAKAERRAENLRKISNSLIVDVHGAIRHLPGSLPARRIILEKAVEQLDTLAQEDSNDPALLVELGEGYQNVGEMYQALGNISEAEKSHRKTVKIYEKLVRENPSVVKYRQNLANAYGFLGGMAYLRGDIAEFKKFYEQNVRILENLTVELPQNIEFQTALWTAYHEQIRVFYLSGKLNEALDLSRRYLQIAENIARFEGKNKDNLFRIFVSRSASAVVLSYLDENSSAVNELEQITKENDKLIRQFPNDTSLQYGSWAFYKRLGDVYLQAGNSIKAQENTNKSLEYMKVLKDTSPEDAGYLRNYSYTLISLAKIYLSENKQQRAIETLQQSKEISEKLYQSDRENGETIGDLAMIYDLLGRAYNNLGKRQKGLDWQEKSLVFYRKFLTKSPQNAVIKTEYIKAAALTSDNYRKLDMETNADKLLNESRRLWQEMRKRKTVILSETADIKKLLSRNG